MHPSLDDFTNLFAEFMFSGQSGGLSQFCASDINVELFNIYRNGYFRAAIDALESNYPCVHALIGGQRFRSMAGEFVRHFPPSTGSLVGYGKEFPEFIRTHQSVKELSCLADIARLDRAWLEVYFAADNVPLDAGTLQTLIETFAESALRRLELVACSRVIEIDYPLTSVWCDLKDHGCRGDVIGLPRDPEYVLVWRTSQGVSVRQLTFVEYIFLSGLKRGLSLEEAAEYSVFEDSNFDPGLFFSSLIQSGLFVAASNQNYG